MANPWQDGLIDAHVSASDVERMIQQLGMDPDGDGMVAKHHLAAPERWMQYLTQLLTESPTKRSRDSEQVWLYPRQLAERLGPDAVLTALQARVAALTQLPLHVVNNSDALQVVRYGTAGHYTTHYDSGPFAKERTCCHLTRPFRSTSREQLQHQSCRLCRFATVLYGLNDAVPGTGGETAFPVAPLTPAFPPSTVDEQNADVIRWRHSPASREGSYCQEGGPLRVRPQKGSALLWYNHAVDETTGTLGELDPLALHAGCPLHENEESGEERDKWIANHWLEASEEPVDDEALATHLASLDGKTMGKRKGRKGRRKGAGKRQGKGDGEV